MVISGENNTYIKNFGYGDREARTPVTADTAFQLASCSKGFTALAVLRLEEEGRLHLDDQVSTYLPWFRARYKKNKNQPITLRQLLHHTSGIPWQTIGSMEESVSDNALEQTARTISGLKLQFEPGERFLYATINYDILGAVVEKITGETFENYMHQEILKPLGLEHTTVGSPPSSDNRASGYKAGFWGPVKFQAPAYRGNNPAGYIYSTPRDVAHWLRLQLGLEEPPLSPLIEKSHFPDTGTPISPYYGGIHYAMGWLVYTEENNRLGHPGLNPNFSCEMIVNKDKNQALAVLANASSQYTYFLARYVWNLLFDKWLRGAPAVRTALSTRWSRLWAILLTAYLSVASFSLLSTITGILKGLRRFHPFPREAIPFTGAVGLGVLLVVSAIWLLPKLKRRYFWKTLITWKPHLFLVAMRLFFASLGMSVLVFALKTLFPAA